MAGHGKKSLLREVYLEDGHGTLATAIDEESSCLAVLQWRIKAQLGEIWDCVHLQGRERFEFATWAAEFFQRVLSALKNETVDETPALAKYKVQITATVVTLLYSKAVKEWRLAIGWNIRQVLVGQTHSGPSKKVLHLEPAASPPSIAHNQTQSPQATF